MKIICIGRNYVDHAKELGNEAPTSPVIFLKPDTALLKNNEDFYYPSFSKDIHYEVEVVLKVSKAGKSILPEFAHKYYDQISLGVDFTARDLQNELREKGLPWEKAKAFDHSAVVSDIWLDKNKLPDVIDFDLKVNGQIVQEGSTKDMLFSFDQIISSVSEFITLKTGDLIFTGTPKGVNGIKIGDQLIGTMNQKEIFNFKIK
jgi:2-keto-4-pentenoate hydratase/2-oxohepta-3-ene-1,7-dioic acid hydratase in catechol pathway